MVDPAQQELWTPSFVLWTGGWATLALLATYWLVEVRHWPAWGRRFGINAIAAYAGSEILQVALLALGWQEPIYQHAFASWIAPLAGPRPASLAFAIACVALWWAVVWWLDRRRIYLKL